MITVISNIHYSVQVIYREEFPQILDLGCNRWHLLIVQMGKVKQSKVVLQSGRTSSSPAN